MNCVLYERDCVKCGECEQCDLNPNEKCNNCGKCIEDDSDYKFIIVDDVIQNRE